MPNVTYYAFWKIFSIWIIYYCNVSSTLFLLPCAISTLLGDETYQRARTNHYNTVWFLSCSRKKMLPKSFSFYEFYLPADLKNRFTTKEYYYKLCVIFQSCHGFFPDEIYSSRFQLDLFLVLCVCWWLLILLLLGSQSVFHFALNR